MESCKVKAFGRMRSAVAVAMAVVLAVGMMPAMASEAYANDSLAAASIETQATDYTAELTFSDDGITAASGGSGYKISNTALTIQAAGTYRISGSCSDGNIVVKKGTTGVTLVLDGLTLASTTTAPIAVNKTASATIELASGTTTTLTDSEDPANETSEDETVKDAFEGACIKVKSGASVTFRGNGTLVANGSSCKNGIKGAAASSLSFESGTYQVSAANNGIAADGSVAIDGGTFDIDAGNDGIKSVPDSDDTTSAGTVTITGGTFNIDAGTGSDGGDGISADAALNISGGTFDIKTMGGSGDSSFKSDTMSAKGLKASSASDDSSTGSSTSTDASSAENAIAISGGTFTLNTADDAVHSDAYITVTGGTFDIATGDDGMHADTSLILGEENGSDSAVNVRVSTSYEGLEGGTVYIFSGTYDVAASDDGVNAAGGSGNGSDPGMGGGNGFNPGGSGPGGTRPGSGMIGRFGTLDVTAASTEAAQASTASSYNIYVYGGDLYVNCSGDGLDSNGGLFLYGGTQQVYSQSNGDNSALDADGTILVQGATIFTAGAKGVDGTAQGSWFGNGQKYVAASKSYSAHTMLTAKAGSTTLGTYTLPKAASYVMFSAPSTSALTLTTGTAGSSTTPGTDSDSIVSDNLEGPGETTVNAIESTDETAGNVGNVGNVVDATVKTDNTMTVKKTTKTVKAKLVAKSKKTVKAITVKKAQGTVTYTKVSGSKYLKVNKKTGKITVAKGTPAGTYKVKVKVKAAGNATYNATSKTVTVKIKVK